MCGVAEMGVADFLTLNPRTVAEHDVGDVASGRRRIDWPGISATDQAGETPNVVVVSVRHDHRVQRAWVERELAVGAVGINSVRIEQPAVKQDSPGIDLQQMSAARDFLGRAVERDSQPNYLPTIDRAPAAHPEHAADRTALTPLRAANQSSLGCPQPLSLNKQSVGSRPILLLLFGLIHSIMPGTLAGFKPENQGIQRSAGSSSISRPISLKKLSTRHSLPRPSSTTSSSNCRSPRLGCSNWSWA